MRILIDENIDPTLTDALREQGHEVIAVQEHTPGIDDIEVLALSVELEALLITEDKKFSDKVFSDLLPCNGVLLLRFPDHYPWEVIEHPLRIVAEYGVQLCKFFSTSTIDNFRMHPLP